MVERVEKLAALPPYNALWAGSPHASCLDRFHVATNMNMAIDKVRAAEAKKLAAEGNDVLKHSRWCVLKRHENLSERQETKLAEFERKRNLKTFSAYLLKESFQGFWDYVSPAWAGKFLDRWCTRTMRSRIEPMKKMARQLRKHRGLLLNWFKARGSISLALSRASTTD